MNWRGLSVSTESVDLDAAVLVDEVWDASEASELLLFPEPLGRRAKGTQSPTDPDYAPGLSVSFKANGSVECEVVDADALADWVADRMSEDERNTLADEFEEEQQEAADDAGEELMRDRARGVA